jgi:hypothetical protein
MSWLILIYENKIIEEYQPLLNLMIYASDESDEREGHENQLARHHRLIDIQCIELILSQLQFISTRKEHSFRPSFPFDVILHGHVAIHWA